MSPLARLRSRTAAAAALPFVAAAAIVACGPELIFRAYLDKTLWHPAHRPIEVVLQGLPAENRKRVAYAGMAETGGSPSVQAARDAYRQLFAVAPPPDRDPSTGLQWPRDVFDRLRRLANAARPGNAAERSELDLLRCKIELRAARGDDLPVLTSVRACFDRYVNEPRPAALTSEARGWIARVDHLLGHDAAASKFYLDELRSATSNIARERLFASLFYIEPRVDDLEGYFDTPGHALFVADRVANRQDDALAVALMQRLEAHDDLFRSGGDSDALALALMRAATRAGAPRTTLRYAARVAPESAARATADYNWLVGAAHFQQNDYAAAETPLRAVFAAADADEERRSQAANALVGVYDHLQRPADQLWAAFELRAHSFEGWSLDLPYLLDVQLTDADLNAYLGRYGDAPTKVESKFGMISSVDAVRYALAVRDARREEYAQAAELYPPLNPHRVVRMREAQRLLDNVRATEAAPRHLEALFTYASFLADHENGIFFNDLFWEGFQSQAFIYRHPDDAPADYPTFAYTATPSAAERQRFARLERRLRDEQEEYWRAYQILDRVVREAGPTPLGRRAAERALRCLRKISLDRFGRAKEILAADRRLSAWLTRQAR